MEEVLRKGLVDLVYLVEYYLLGLRTRGNFTEQVGVRRSGLTLKTVLGFRTDRKRTHIGVTGRVPHDVRISRLFINNLLVYLYRRFELTTHFICSLFIFPTHYSSTECLTPLSSFFFPSTLPSFLVDQLFFCLALDRRRLVDKWV